MFPVCLEFFLIKDFKDLTKEQIEEYTKKFQLEQENQMEEGEELE